MPLPLDPTATFPVHLPRDADKPESERPTFIARVGSMRDARKVSDLWQQAINAKDAKDEEAACLEAMRLAFVGWRNLPEPFGEWDAVLSGTLEMYALLKAWVKGRSVSEAELLGFTSPAASDGASSAPPAPPASAETPQAHNSPFASPAIADTTTPAPSATAEATFSLPNAPTA